MMREPLDVAGISPLDHVAALELAAAEYQQVLEQLGRLGPDDWHKPTDCPGWDVRTIASHLVASAHAHVSLRQLVHQMRLGRRQPPPLADAISAIQVAERGDLTPAQLLDSLTTLAPRSVRARRRIPALIRKIPIAYDSVDPPERWTLGFLLDVIYLRDCWMHRIDIARAVDLPPVLSAHHDGKIVTDVVAEWARRHGQPFDLTLTGPAGGHFTSRPDTSGAPSYELDAVEFCRLLSGRHTVPPPAQLPTTAVPF